MKKVTAKNIQKLRMKSIWPSIVFLFSSFIMGVALIAVLLSAVVVCIVENRYFESKRQADTLREAISEKVSKGEDYESILEDIQNGVNYPVAITIMDGNQKTLAAYGDEMRGNATQIAVDDVKLNISLDKPEYVLSEDDNALSVNISGIVRGFADKISVVNETNNVSEIINTEVYRFGYWIGLSVNSHSDIIYMKFEQILYMNDCLFVLPIVGVAAMILLISSIIHFVNMLVNILTQRSLVKMLLKDPVTGGNNMLAFEQYAQKTLFKKKKYGYAIVDLSLTRYQNYCTLYGISEGERLISNIERYLIRATQRGEFVAKVSNSDFALLLRTNQGAGVFDRFITRANSIVAGIPYAMQDDRFVGIPMQGVKNLILKGGMYVIPPALSNEDRIKRNDQSNNISQIYMKAGIAKQSLIDESGIVIYSHDMWESEQWEQKVEDKMQAAMDAEEFQVYIQPKYNPNTDELRGGEALVRWISPEDGFISPGMFVPIFEKTGFVTKLDDYMISHTAALQARWLKEGKKIVPISVNVSRIHFSQPDLAEHIRDLVDRYELPHQYIEIELTESAFLDDKKAMLTTVQKLQEYGFEVSMDDFGSGYSSLNSLKDLPLNVLKLDAEFFRGDDFDERGEVVVSEAIALAKQLNMKIVAEGVEKKEQVEFLAGQDCDMIQGYYYSKPLPAAEYETRMSEK